MKLHRVVVPSLVACAALAAGTAATQASVLAPPARPAGATASSVRVTLAEFSLRPRPAAARSGRVTFTVRNAGRIRHEFVVLRTRRAARSLLRGAEASEAGNVGEIGNVPAGATRRLTLRLRAGHYALICNLPGHYRAGQYADFRVR